MSTTPSTDPTTVSHDPEPVIDLGRIVTTRGIAEHLNRHPWMAAFIQHCLTRHRTGDWGTVDPDDSDANETAAALGGRLVSAYPLPHHPTLNPATAPTAPRDELWIITEADRTVTTVLWPDEY